MVLCRAGATQGIGAANQATTQVVALCLAAEELAHVFDAAQLAPHGVALVGGHASGRGCGGGTR